MDGRYTIDNLGQQGNFTLGDQGLKTLIHNEQILNTNIESQVMPASIDLMIEGGWQMKGSLPRRGNETNWDLIKNFKKEDLNSQGILEVGETYMFHVTTRLNLNDCFHGYANPKSTSGRDGAVVHLKTDGTTRNDIVPNGYLGDLWIEVTPEVFPLICKEGSRFNQLRLFDGNPYFTDLDLAKLYAKNPFMFTPYGKEIAPNRDMFKNGLVQRINLDLDIPGFISKENSAKLDPIDIDNAKGDIPFEDYWDVLDVSKDESITIPKDRMVIAVTYELNRIPAHLAGEMTKADETTSGGLSAHDAGFFDPGFGNLEDQIGAGGVLEIRAMNSNKLIRHKDAVTSLKFSRVFGCAQQYGEKSNYQGQSYDPDPRKIVPRLPKHFTMP